MNGQPPRYRTIRYDRAFDESLAHLRTSPAPDRVDEAVAALEWSVARDPDRYPIVAPELALDLRIARTRAAPDLPSLRLYFTVDDEDHCTMRYIEQADLFADEEDFS